ncbi:MAG: imidazole glycerol phosphate synthase subunit HisH [Actinobacteria bacterium]|nr:imidazole glycerol phosphate synthase subunit HisH [Actinomycetota bacterium]
MSAGPLIAVLDYGMGNLRSVEKAIEHVGARAKVTSDHEAARRAAGIVLPGVGAFPRAMDRMRTLGLDELIAERVANRTPTLGICLGLQLLFESSEELGGSDGLGLVRGTVAKLDAPGLKLPQIGWNEVTWRRRGQLDDGLPERCAFYHVHTYAPAPASEQDVLATATYGSDFVTAIDHAPVYGVQFHPEKSGPDGLRLLANFIRVCDAGLARAA